ncbi:alpha/beta hydrolase [Bacillus sp. DJP31]|uniref:alpha/beta hydrolase n=1 Tax=Bacillus sp. DJP31 TaxID=3409789 RepID=UPI003BB5FC1C
MNQHQFILDGEWNVVHLPERPNGFAIFVIGDRNHFVDHSTSFWIQNAGRFTFLKVFLDNGYTVFYSNLFGRNYGSHRAVAFAKRLYHVVMKREILNECIHILVEGMGALTGLQLMDEMGDKLRSVAMLNPCLSLRAQLIHEQENKLFYKRVVKEVLDAYEWEEHEFDEQVKMLPTIKDHTGTSPVKMWISTDEKTYQSKKMSRIYEQNRNKNSPIQLVFHVNEKRFGIGSSLLQFFEKHERTL